MKNREILYLYLLLITCLIINYFTPKILSQLWFWMLLVIFVRAGRESNYFWIVFFWLVFSSPGYLFYNAGIYALPTISIPGMGRQIYYDEVVVISAILKALFSRQRVTIYYKKYLIMIIFFSVILLLSSSITGMKTLTLLKSVRYFIPLLLLWFLPNLIPRVLVPRTINLMFASVFCLVGAQLFDLLFGFPFAGLLGETQLFFSGHLVDSTSKIFDVSAGAVRTVYGPFILLLSMIISLSLLAQKRDIFNSKYLMVITLLSAVSIFMSATRGWVIGIMFVIIGFSLLRSTKFSRLIVFTLVVISALLMVPKLNLQFVQSFDRLLTLKSLMKGDLTPEGTLSRLTERGPRVMRKFREQPFIGFGFSDEYYKYLDPHVGNQSLLLNGGILGFLNYLFFILLLLRRYWIGHRYQKNKAAYILLFGLISLAIIHSSSTMVFGYALDTSVAIPLSIFLLLSDYFLSEVPPTTKLPATF